ncbi:hypothetical protein FRC11_012219, partial [Ceratobasidium sp. 423]
QNSFVAFLAFLAVRTKSLGFYQPDEDFNDLAPGTFLENCTPGVLIHVSTSELANATHQVILAQGQEVPEDTVADSTLLLDVPEQRLEDVMLGLTTSRSGGTYPLWDSKAYHGLIDLYLGGTCEIPELRLVAILNSSPQLRSLGVALQITDTFQSASPVEPITLVELERLSLENSCDIGMLLRWIAPGPKLLRLILGYGEYNLFDLDPFLKDQPRIFLRSNTTRVSVKMSEYYSALADLFGATSTIKELPIDCANMEINYRYHDILNLEPPLRLDTLYLFGRNSNLEMEYLLEFIRAQGVQNIGLIGLHLLGTTQSAGLPHAGL